ncbi:MAG: DUF488 domain-containing protein [Candidatus Methanomethylicota archaeon]|uniref:DUF488 domain-containing protein n=1 Tax=Thermoproteota archaeon TaxID=2056631 RepID=A0A497ERX6_9CREN|nr:MAG: DUF488 domain-containing protein [Candidatus Verstraetearchaeota archaeon]RLE53093.1 MAG: DUF488 domain-containing protein [Candidatus Verstraetearchaeota archaeon]
MSRRVYTIGHSNRSLENFLFILKLLKVDLLVDVRRFPTSSKYPHFKREVLEEAVEKEGIRYIWLGEELGGFREISYEEYVKTKDFERALDHLILTISQANNPAIMCSEMLWFKCHRRFISDELVRRGWEVIHVIDSDKRYRHKLKVRG